jgi:transcriptional regulator with XRE-family HTH domain
MRCTCDQSLKAQQSLKTPVQSYRYSESGLSSVYLVKSIAKTACREHGAGVILPKLGHLHATIAAALASKPQRLAPEEARFLRKALGWSAIDYAKRIGATPETVSRWENGKTPIGPQSERLLRLLAVRHLMIPAFGTSTLEQIETGNGIATPTRLEFQHDSDGWTARKVGKLGGRPKGK